MTSNATRLITIALFNLCCLGPILYANPVFTPMLLLSAALISLAHWQTAEKMQSTPSVLIVPLAILSWLSTQNPGFILTWSALITAKNFFAIHEGHSLKKTLQDFLAPKIWEIPARFVSSLITISYITFSFFILYSYAVPLIPQQLITLSGQHLLLLTSLTHIINLWCVIPLRNYIRQQPGGMKSLVTFALSISLLLPLALSGSIEFTYLNVVAATLVVAYHHRFISATFSLPTSSRINFDTYYKNLGYALLTGSLAAYSPAFVLSHYTLALFRQRFKRDTIFIKRTLGKEILFLYQMACETTLYGLALKSPLPVLNTLKNHLLPSTLLGSYVNVKQPKIKTGFKTVPRSPGASPLKSFQTA